MKRGYLYLFLAALSYASMGVLVKMLSFDMGPFMQTFLRLIVSCLLTAGFVVLRKKPLLLSSKKDYLLMFFMGTIGYGLQIVFYTMALYHTTISNTLFIFSSYPIVAAFLAHYVLRERITKRHIVAMILLSCVLFLLFNPTSLSTYLLGNTYALLASATTAFYIIGSRSMSKRGNSPETITLWSVLLAIFVSGLGAVQFEHETVHLTSLSIFFLVLFGLFNALAFNFLNKGFATVNAATGTMLLLLEPIIGSFLGFVFFQEVPTMLFLTGAIIMVTTIYIATFKLD